MNIASRFEGAYGTMYYVYDMAKTVKFYREVFDLIPRMESPAWTEFDLNGHTLCLHAINEGERVDGKGILISKVKGLREIADTLKARGAEIISDVHEVCEGGFALDYKDPSGNVLSLFEHLE